MRRPLAAFSHAAAPSADSCLVKVQERSVKGGVAAVKTASAVRYGRQYSALVAFADLTGHVLTPPSPPHNVHVDPRASSANAVTTERISAGGRLQLQFQIALDWDPDRPGSGTDDQGRQHQVQF